MVSVMPISTNWLKNAVIYNILIDRFARGNNEDWINHDSLSNVFCGGNLQGIIDRLDYLEDLGVTAILLTPFHPTVAYHGYHILDFFGVDPRFGTLAILKELILKAHERGIKVIMDFVINHVSKDHAYFRDAKNNPASPYRDWFYFIKWPDTYLSFLEYRELPKLNLDNPTVKVYVMKVVAQWLEAGIDGFRIDHVIGVSHEFLNDLREVIKRHNSDAILIGEAVKGRITWRELKTLRFRYKYVMYILSQAGINISFFLQLQYRQHLDGIFDFFFRDMIKLFIVKRTWYKPLWLLRWILVLYRALYPKHFSLVELLEVPDRDRFSFLLRGDRARLKQAVQLQAAQPEPIMVLYGSEAGIVQHRSWQGKAYGDLEVRGLMPWKHIDVDMVNFYKEVIRCRAVPSPLTEVREDVK